MTTTSNAIPPFQIHHKDKEGNEKIFQPCFTPREAWENAANEIRKQYSGKVRDVGDDCDKTTAQISYELKIEPTGNFCHLKTPLGEFILKKKEFKG